MFCSVITISQGLPNLFLMHMLSHACRMAAIYLIGFIYRFKYYFAWVVSEAALVLSGFSYCGWDEKNVARWDRYSNARIIKVELCTSLAELPIHWNTCTGTFLRHCEAPHLPTHSPSCLLASLSLSNCQLFASSLCTLVTKGHHDDG